MKIELRELSITDDMDIFEMIKEIGPGENGFSNTGYDMGCDEFPDYLEENSNNAKGINLRPGYVPQTVYWLFADSKPVGIGKLRHYLNDFLLDHGGHIGYSIRPSERGKGFGTVMLREILKEARRMGLREVLLICNEVNTPSKRVIEANKGCLEGIYNGECKYWITL